MQHYTPACLPVSSEDQPAVRFVIERQSTRYFLLYLPLKLILKFKMIYYNISIGKKEYPLLPT